MLRCYPSDSNSRKYSHSRDIPVLFLTPWHGACFMKTRKNHLIPEDTGQSGWGLGAIRNSVNLTPNELPCRYKTLTTPPPWRLDQSGLILVLVLWRNEKPPLEVFDRQLVVSTAMSILPFMKTQIQSTTLKTFFPDPRQQSARSGDQAPKSDLTRRNELL